MPLYKTITVHPSTHIFVWKIKESVDELMRNIDLTDQCKSRLDQMKSETHQREFLSIRLLLKKAGYAPADLYYDEKGKPHLKDNYYISITHATRFSGIIISTKPVGIDIEEQRDKIMRIADKFTPLKEYRTLANEEAIIRKLTLVWCAKEAIYKVMGIPGLPFLRHIYVNDFDLGIPKITAEVDHKGIRENFKLKFLEFENFSCVYTLPLDRSKGD